MNPLKIFIIAGFSATVLLAVCLASAHSKRARPRSGIASWYGENYRGKTMANGQPFNPDAMTCASFHYPLGTYLRVTYFGRSVVVEVTDRGPAKHLNRLIDLSARAFAGLAELNEGLITVDVEPVIDEGDE